MADNRLVRQPSSCWFVLWLLLGAFLAACGGGVSNSVRFGSDVALVGDAYLVCSAMCRSQGQCGQANPGGDLTFPAVLINSGAPATRNHSNLASTNSAVQIQDVRSETMQVMSGPDAGQSFALPFYLVTIPTLNDGAYWVAGWCVADQPVE